MIARAKKALLLSNEKKRIMDPNTVPCGRAVFENVQHLRAFAAIIVVFEHILYRGESYGQAAVYALRLKGWGLSGVDIFFVISGFVMVYSQVRSPKRPTDFFIGRILRIVPLYWSLTIVLALLIVVFPNAFRTLSFDTTHVLASLLFICQEALADVPFIDVGWTLEWEMLFYVFFAATILVRPIELQLFVLSSVLLMVAAFLDRFFILEFVLGMLAAYIMLNLDIRRHGLLLFGIGAAAFLSDIYFSWEADRLFI